MKIIHETENSISICDTQNNNLTKSFMKKFKDEEGREIINLNFEKEVEKFTKDKNFLNNL